ncbi:MAG: hypothetical protein P8X74_21790 [Reinekea sp.]
MPTYADADQNQLNTSLFALANFTDDSPQYLQLEWSRRVGTVNYLGLEFITWRYSAPLGIPYGPSFGDSDEDYPGTIRDIGLGVTWQHYFGKGLFTKVHVMPMLQSYFDTAEEPLQNGWQLFTTARVGYHLSWASERFFIEPSIAATSWPIRTHVPKSFAEQDAKWSGYFLFEPGLNIGIRF